MLAYVDEIASFFRLLVDEPDKTFLTDAAVTSILKVAYSQYYGIVSDISEDPFSGVHNISNVVQYVDLAAAPNNLVGAVGPYAGFGRMTRLNAVHAITETGAAIATKKTNYLYTYPAAQDTTAFAMSNQLSYMWTNGTLMFSSTGVASTIQLAYSYYPDIDWTKLNSGDLEDLQDPLYDFHDIIAYLAYKIYAIKDVAINQPMEAQLAQRIIDLKSFLQQGQTFQSSHYVSREWRR